MFELSVERATAKQTSLVHEFNHSFSCAMHLIFSRYYWAEHFTNLSVNCYK